MILTDFNSTITLRDKISWVLLSTILASALFNLVVLIAKIFDLARLKLRNRKQLLNKYRIG